MVFYSNEIADYVLGKVEYKDMCQAKTSTSGNSSSSPSAPLQSGSELEAGPWQPIETAPKDGTVILLGFPPSKYLSGTVRCGAWVQNGCHINHGTGLDGTGWFALYISSGFVKVKEPTHWMPLPNPPAAKTSDI